MTPEYVAEGFFQLVTKGGNGSCMLVLNNTPYLMVKNKQADFNHKPVSLKLSPLFALSGRYAILETFCPFIHYLIILERLGMQ